MNTSVGTGSERGLKQRQFIGKGRKRREVRIENEAEEKACVHTSGEARKSQAEWTGQAGELGRAPCRAL